MSDAYPRRSPGLEGYRVKPDWESTRMIQVPQSELSQFAKSMKNEATWKEKSQRLSLIKMRTKQITLHKTQCFFLCFLFMIFLCILPNTIYPRTNVRILIPYLLRQCWWRHSLWCLCDFQIATRESGLIDAFSEEFIKLLKNKNINGYSKDIEKN